LQGRGQGEGGRRIGVLGGTFDPIHYGHLDAANAARSSLDLDEVLIVPSHDPPHRPTDPRTSPFHRFALVSLAIDGLEGFRASDVELTREGPSYTMDTLIALHADGLAASQIFFILGADAFAEIATWYAFPDVLDAANFVAIERPGTTIEVALSRTPGLRDRALPPDVSMCETGRTCIFVVEAHTRDVSSTSIRERIAAGRPIDDLVPPAVARHILRHRIYQATETVKSEK
jgi:nicotinate-nucleotide adenylyltransferase